MITVVRASLVAGILVATVQAAAAAGNAEDGRRKAETCLGCHAAPNAQNTYPMFRVPKVGGQHPEYLSAALKAYRAGERPHGTMHANAANLSDQDIEDISAYFAGDSE